MQSRMIRVVPAEYGWTLELPGLPGKSQRFSTLDAAIAAGWSLAKRESADLHIVRHDGPIYLRSSHGSHNPQN